jgi:ribosomal-protein-alanine N-acetyltransferase
MSENSKSKLMKWVSSEDMNAIAKLCRMFNQNKIYEIFWEYCGLTANMLTERGAYGWLYYENSNLSGFALGRQRRGVFIFEEVWGQCDGTSNEIGELSRKGRERALQFRKSIDSLDFDLPVVLRAATDNQFAHMIARLLKARWVNGLIIAERKLNRKFGFSTPSGYAFKMFENGDQFYMSGIHKETFKEDFSMEDYKKWTTAVNCRTIIATHQNEPIGFIIAEKRHCGSLGDFNIAVKPAHQGKGIGSALLKAALNVFIDLKVKRVIADYLILNASAHNLYQKLGFEPKRTYNYFLIGT